MSAPADERRDRDQAGRARNARARDDLGRPLARTIDGEAPVDEPALSPPEALRRAQELLDAGRPFTAHEVFEAVWKDTAGPSRELWRGLAQIAVGITHSLRGNDSGAHSLLLRGADALEPFAGTTPYKIDVDGVRAWALLASEDAALAALPPRLTVKDHKPKAL
jgi:predicted metal-dependent hydrolase